MVEVEYRSVILAPHDLTAEAWIPTMAAAGLNTLMLHAVRLPDDITHLVNHRTSDAGQSLLKMCRQRGIAVEYQLHTASWLLPRALYHKHPDWFRMDQRGRRVPDCNLCFTCDEAWEFMAPRIKGLMAALASDTGRHLWFADDVANGGCYCPRCKALHESDQGMLYANRLIGVMREVDPGARVSYLSYHATLPPPRSIEPADGVFLEYAPHRRTYLYTIGDPECAVNRCHLDALRATIDWFGGRPFHVTEYWLDVGYHSGYRRPAQPLPVAMDVVQRDVECYRELGCQSIATYAVYGDAEYWEHVETPPLEAYGAILKGMPRGTLSDT